MKPGFVPHDFEPIQKIDFVPDPWYMQKIGVVLNEFGVTMTPVDLLLSAAVGAIVVIIVLLFTKRKG